MVLDYSARHVEQQDLYSKKWRTAFPIFLHVRKEEEGHFQQINDNGITVL